MLLEDGSFNVSEVAFAVGFNDPKYFTKSFKKQFGKSPREYQNEIIH
jgi:AraC-like DNA-binding protein